MSALIRIGRHPYHDDPNCHECPPTGSTATFEDDLWEARHPIGGLLMGLIGVVAFLLALWLLAVMFAPPAQAHDGHELDAWVAAWEAERDEAIAVIVEQDALSVFTVNWFIELRAEWADMADRHPCYFYGECEALREMGEPPSPPASAPASHSSPGVEQWRGLVAAYFPGSAVDTMLCLMWHESKGDPGATNPRSGAAGLFQVMPFWWDHYGGDRYDPESNVRVARLIYGEQGFGAWSPWNRGLCRG